jgi:mono/diheme cytochrome c family protein
VRRLVAIVALGLVVAQPAAAGVRVVPPFELERYEGEAALGLLVPGAGPTVTREAALAALLRGRVEHDLLGGVPGGEPLLELDEPGEPEILVSLPPPGRSENDVRYPIAVLGWDGVLTSDSTRIDGLVSVTDVATGRLRAVDSEDPVEALERLDRRIDRNDRWRMPLSFVLAGIVLALAALRPRLAVRALLVALAANLWLEPALAVAAGAAAVALPLGLASAATLGAYLLAMGLDAETVALSPFGPSQSGRFYGVNNLIETLLLVPSFVGAALLGRAGVLVAVLAFVTIGGNRFGADGGGLVVLAAGYAVLVFRLRGLRLTARRLALLALAAVAIALAVLAIDAATGGESHVTEAVGDGPGALAGDLADRIELSVRRTAASAGPIAVVLVGLALLVAVAFRKPRSAVVDAYLAAIAVSLLVNDTPADVIGIGAVAAVALARAGPDAYESGTGVDSAAMRRAAVLALLALLLVGVVGCGGGEETAPTAETVEGTLPEETTEEEPASTLEGDAAAGEEVFTANGCGSCHTMEAAGTSGSIGPNLDESQPDFELVVDRVTNGQGAMPAFGDQLSEQQIADVAAYVVDSTSG